MMHQDPQPCSYLYFGLLVTGKGEQKHLPLLFRALEESGIAHFRVIRKIDQLSASTSPNRQAHVVGTSKRIPSKDIERIAYPARKFLQENPCGFILLIDDMEHDRRPQAQAIFARYQQTLTQVLDDRQKLRAAVHFLVNMLEAYFFADARAVNQVLDCAPPLEDYPGDVEQIRHPKGDLKRRCKGYSETKTMGDILARLDVAHILARPDTCASLRTIFDWCICQMDAYAPDFYHASLDDLRRRFHIHDGVLHPVTRDQCSNAMLHAKL